MAFEVEHRKAHLHIRLTEKEKTIIQELADKEGLTVTDLVRVALGEYIKNHAE